MCKGLSEDMKWRGPGGMNGKMERRSHSNEWTKIGAYWDEPKREELRYAARWKEIYCFHARLRLLGAQPTIILTQAGSPPNVFSSSPSSQPATCSPTVCRMPNCISLTRFTAACTDRHGTSSNATFCFSLSPLDPMPASHFDIPEKVRVFLDVGGCWPSTSK
ncbi:hypothetical protein BKA80DRAFT_94966 [Phyllosticta citrichinensis]